MLGCVRYHIRLFVFSDLNNTDEEAVECNESGVENLSQKVLTNKETLENLNVRNGEVEEANDTLSNHKSMLEVTLHEKGKFIKHLILFW